ncbi:hypothetical protein ACFVKB_24140 [Rhodococcus sp. NPDC127530]|uniref:hypothetical protein n=1 Tax=unclassified Rhodococcus (in: high G+C Gram-positive bacteria) TaxID=192944 RepID=UPI0036313534
MEMNQKQVVQLAPTSSKMPGPFKGFISSPQIIANFAVALLVVSVTFRMNRGTRYFDERGYLEIGRGLLQGRYQLSGVPTAYRPPSWPLVIAGARALGISEAALFIVPPALLIIASILAGYIGNKLGGSMAGVIASVMVGLYPLNLYTATTLYPQSLALACVLALWAMYLSVATDPDKVKVAGRVVFAGLLAGLLALAVPTLALTAVVFVSAISLVLCRRRRFLQAGLGVVASGIPIGIWSLRNLLTFGEPIPLSTSTGINLLLGNNPLATASSGLAVDIGEAKAVASAMRMNEIERNHYFGQIAIDWVRENPAEATTLYLAKMLNYFSPYNSPVSDSGVDAPQSIQFWVAAGCGGIIISFVVVRLACAKKLEIKSAEWLAIVVFFMNAPVMAVFFTRTRFRQPLDSLLIVEAAIGISIVLTMSVCYVRNQRRNQQTVYRARLDGDD